MKLIYLILSVFVIAGLAFMPGCVSLKANRASISKAYQSGKSANDAEFIEILKEVDKQNSKVIRERNVFKHRIEQYLNLKCECRHKAVLEDK